MVGTVRRCVVAVDFRSRRGEGDEVQSLLLHAISRPSYKMIVGWLVGALGEMNVDRSLLRWAR